MLCSGGGRPDPDKRRWTAAKDDRRSPATLLLGAYTTRFSRPTQLPTLTLHLDAGRDRLRSDRRKPLAPTNAVGIGPARVDGAGLIPAAVRLGSMTSRSALHGLGRLSNRVLTPRSPFEVYIALNATKVVLGNPFV